ncbi:Putative Fe-S oxidoreductase [Thermococcus nautili]|uniref:radical SAM protein n=1 Tax=Thermococcus nautili TaxID=195522 RepID=UPI0025530B4B|nr:radical SAM protein [Thermococcus nautili]CAI1492849.1 Putative Fe-S oxidoreductase [Thermococcus nautili]
MQNVIEPAVTLETLGEKYVSLTGGTVLGIYPHLASIYRGDVRRIVNLDAAQVLRMCDGRRKASEVAGSLSPSEEERRKILEFLLTAVENGDVVVSDTPINAPFEVAEHDYILPSHVVFELTENCNLNCAHCYRIKERAPLYMPLEAFKRIIDFLSEPLLVGIELTGGEPTLHPNFVEIVEYAAERLELVGVLTNGLYLPPGTIEKLSSYMDKLFFSVSLDSHDPTFHDEFRGLKGAWKRTVENIKRLTDAGFNVRIAMTIVPENIDHVEKVAELAVELGVKMFTYSPMLPFGRADGFTWSNEDLWRISEVDKRVRRRFSGVIPVARMEELEASLGNCGAGWRSVTIGPDLSVRMCVVSDPERDVLFRLDPKRPEESFRNAREKLAFFYGIRAPGPWICGNCRFLSFCTPCVLRARYVLEKGLIAPEECRWASTIGIGALKKYLQVKTDG